jgi:phosphoglycolate phosphatase-like HAD superfamily hydrolase
MRAKERGEITDTSMSKTAVLWIRDGVLVDRMHINPVAFAFAVWVFSAPERCRKTTLEGLINFGFEKSGFSCAEKMQLYNSECENVLSDVQTAAGYYNVLASQAATEAEYFTGIIELLRDLQSAGIQNFITSAVEQDVLDAWSHNQQGSMIAPYLKEILGKRHNFSKGQSHFQYVSQDLGCENIYYVADATAEIQSGTAYSEKYNITPVGFGNVITVGRVMEAIKLVSQAIIVCGVDKIPMPISAQQIQVDGAKISLPDERGIEIALCQAGAISVVTGSSDTIVQNLRGYFEERGVLQPVPKRFSRKT